MTQRFERRLPNTSFGTHDAHKAAEAGGMTLEELERYFIRAIVDDYNRVGMDYVVKNAMCFGKKRCAKQAFPNTWERQMISNSC